VFDSFERAIHGLAPTCSHCSCLMIGHAVEAAERYYCSARCARKAGVAGARDRARAPTPLTYVRLE